MDLEQLVLPDADHPIGRCRESKLVAFITRFADERDIYFDSLLDVGFGGKPLDQWFANYRRGEAPRRYVGIDTDVAAVDKAKERGALAYRGFNAPFDLRSDLVVAADVLEHLSPAGASALLRSCAANTGKMFALSTTNAGFWRKSGVNPEHAWLKWVPDSVIRCYRDAEDPARIKSTVDAAGVLSLMREAFDAASWEVLVFEAWPWELRDLSSPGGAGVFYLRTFALALPKKDANGSQY